MVLSIILLPIRLVVGIATVIYTETNEAYKDIKMLYDAMVGLMSIVAGIIKTIVDHMKGVYYYIQLCLNMIL